MTPARPATGRPATTFLSAPYAAPGEHDARFAVLGIGHGVPYAMRDLAASVTEAPRVVRERSARYGAMLAHHDFDLDAPLADLGALRLVDAGDVLADPRDLAGHAARATAAVRAIVAAAAMPIVLGGDDSTTALAIAGCEAQGPFTVLQIDAHIDYRDEVGGVRDGYSSPMRRAAEMGWVERIVHCGARGVGSARAGDVADTLARGNRIVTARAVHEGGVGAVLQHFPPGGRYYVAFDCDGVDPSVMPGTSAPLPGGLSFYQAADLITGLAARGRIVGINFAEHYPSLDVNGITALAIVRLIVSLLGATLRTGPAA